MANLDNINSLNDLENYISKILPFDDKVLKFVANRENILTKPQDSLGMLEEVTKKICLSQQSYPPKLDIVETIIFAGAHGITAQNISAFPNEVNTQMLLNFHNGGAAINQLCHEAGSKLKVVDCGIDNPTNDFSKKPSMSEEGFLKSFKLGFDSVNKQCDLIALGEMGIGNTTSASAIYTALYGGKAQNWVGAGTGLDDQAQIHKAYIIDTAINLHSNMIKNPLQIARYFAGREIIALAGAMIATRIHNIPTIIDGFVVSAATSFLNKINSQATAHLLYGHISHEQAHIKALEKLNAQALLNLNMRLGEGSGATLAINIIRSAITCHNKMASFDEAVVSNKN